MRPVVFFCCIVSCLYSNAQESISQDEPNQAALYDLRGPGLQVGDTIISENRAVAKINAVEIPNFGTIKPPSVSKSNFIRTETRILAMKERKVTKFESKNLEHDSSITPFDFRQSTDDEGKPLLNVTVIGELQDGGVWDFSLADQEASDVTTDQLERPIPHNFDLLFPEAKVPVGHSWSVEAASLKGYIPDQSSEFSSFEGNAKFSKIEVHKGEECAVIEFSVKVASPMESVNDGETEVEHSCEGEGKVWKSLKTGLCRRIWFEGSVQSKILDLKNLEETDSSFDIKVLSTMSHKSADQP